VDRSRAYLGEIDVWFANVGVDRGKGLDASDPAGRRARR
jgi:hypothetical protein